MGQRFDSYSFFDGTSMTPVTQVTWSNYWRGVVPDGVVAGIGDEMRVYGNSTGMYVYVAPGACIADNHRAVVESVKQIPISESHSAYPRIDVIVARVVYGNENQSYIELDVLTGEPDTDPVAPTLTQSTGSVYEVKLAEVYVEANVITLTPETVTDFRNVFKTGMQSPTFINADTDPLEKGMLVKLSPTMEYAVVRCRNEDIPVGVVESEYIAVGAGGQVATIPGMIAEIKCSEEAVTIGDALVMDEITAGIAHAGGGYAGGVAMQNKEEGAVGNVKSLLTFFAKLPVLKYWYRVGEIREDQVIAAYQFVDRLNEEAALKNVNQGEIYPLTKSGNVTWSTERGFYIPGEDGARLTNQTLQDLYGSVFSGAFGYHGATMTENYVLGGILLAGPRFLTIMDVTGRNGASIQFTKHTMNADLDENTHNTITTGNALDRGVLAGNWDATNPKIYRDGIAQAFTSATGYSKRTGGERAAVIGHRGSTTDTDISGVLGSFYVTACVLYTVQLSADDHAQLAYNIKSLGGIA